MTHQDIVNQLAALEAKHDSEQSALRNKQHLERQEVQFECARIGHLFVRQPFQGAVKACAVCRAPQSRPCFGATTMLVPKDAA